MSPYPFFQSTRFVALYSSGSPGSSLVDRVSDVAMDPRCPRLLRKETQRAYRTISSRYIIVHSSHSHGLRVPACTGFMYVAARYSTSGTWARSSDPLCFTGCTLLCPQCEHRWEHSTVKVPLNDPDSGHDITTECPAFSSHVMSSSCTVDVHHAGGEIYETYDLSYWTLQRP